MSGDNQRSKGKFSSVGSPLDNDILDVFKINLKSALLLVKNIN